MKSQRDRYEQHIKEITVGFMKANRKKLKRTKLDYNKISELIKNEIPYKDFLLGRKIKKISINGMSYARKTKLSDPSNFQPSANINIKTF